MVIMKMLEGYFDHRYIVLNRRLDTVLSVLKENNAPKEKIDEAFKCHYNRLTFNIDEDAYDELDGMCHAVAISKSKNDTSLYKLYYYTEYVKRIAVAKTIQFFSCF